MYFGVRSFADYGKLSKQRIDELEEGVRVDSEPGKDDPLDFAVWKAAKPGEPAWDSPWGMGRPGWHIECSAMGLRYLGAGFDVHGGGRDLIFPHHENEIAQSEAAGLPFASVWMHNGMIRSEGEKMAKSVGNIFLLREVLDRYEPAVVLTYFLTTHYRSPLEFSLEKLDEAKAAYGRFADALADLDFRIANAGRAAAAGRVAGRDRCARRRRAWRSPSTWTTTSTPRPPSASSSPWSARRTATWPRSTAARRRWTPRPWSRCARCFASPWTCSSCRRRRRPSRPPARQRPRATAAEACVTGDVALLPAARLAEEDRWDDVALVYADRLGCGDASYAVRAARPPPRREGVGGGRPHAR